MFVSNNPSLVLHGAEDLRIENVSPDLQTVLAWPAAHVQRPVPVYGSQDVLIEVHKTGICGSDVHYLKHGRIGDYIVEEPMCLGHESAGIVVAAGDGARLGGLAVGDRVALEPGVG